MTLGCKARCGELCVVLVYALSIAERVGQAGGEAGRDGVILGIHIHTAAGAVAIGLPLALLHPWQMTIALVIGLDA